jgi:hypothetical protein
MQMIDLQEEPLIALSYCSSLKERYPKKRQRQSRKVGSAMSFAKRMLNSVDYQLRLNRLDHLLSIEFLANWKTPHCTTEATRHSKNISPWLSALPAVVDDGRIACLPWDEWVVTASAK